MVFNMWLLWFNCGKCGKPPLIFTTLTTLAGFFYHAFTTPLPRFFMGRYMSAEIRMQRPFSAHQSKRTQAGGGLF